MIDLRNNVLPDCLEVDGELFDIDTGFRTWLKVGDMLGKRKVPWLDIAALVFRDAVVPVGTEWTRAVLDFYESRNATPRESGGASVRVVDYVLDGDYIVAAFQHAYGIDLTDPELEMHWHRFLALFRGLPDDTTMARIMGYRSWKQSKKKHEAVMQELKRRWTLPERAEDVEEAEREKARVLELFNERYS